MPNAKKEKCNVNNTNIQILKVIPKIFYFPSIKCMLPFFKCFKYYSYNRVLKFLIYTI